MAQLQTNAISENSNNTFTLSLQQHNVTLDNIDTQSHYSDSVATMKPVFHRMATDITTTRSRNNNVTFSNCIGERGSLKRNKGRSFQSLCSCDDTEILPNSLRPSYEYNFGKRNVTHTYTCEQNAQILMKLEREKRKMSMTHIDKQGNEVDIMLNDSYGEAQLNPSMEYHNITNSLDTKSSKNNDFVPQLSPSAQSRKLVNHYFQQNDQIQQQQNFQRKQQQYHMHQDSINDYNSSITTSSIRDTESVINDCTSTILNCANVGHSLGSSNKIYSYNNSAIKPDLCNISDSNRKTRSNQDNNYLASLYIRDDIYIPCFNKSKNESSLHYSYKKESPKQYALNFDNHSNNRKFNTIGSNSCYAKYVVPYYQQNVCNLANVNDTLEKETINLGNDVNDNSSSQQSEQGLTDYHHWHRQHDNEYNVTASHTSIPCAQFQTPTKNIVHYAFGESIPFDNSYTPVGNSLCGLKMKLHHNNHQEQQIHIHNGTSGTPWKHRQCSSRGSSSSGTNSFKFDASRHWLAVSSILLIVGAASVAVPMALRVAASAPFEERLRAATQLLDEVPLIDGHNDLPWNIRKFLHNKLNDFNFDEDLRNVMPWARSHWSHTDLQRLKKGRVSAQFWAAYVPCEAQHRDAVQLTLEQIDIIKRLTERYSPQLTGCTSASDIIEAHKNHQICSLTGVEGGHSIGGSLAVLRALYSLGVRYMTLTSTCHTPWADSSSADAPTYNVKHGGLTTFGKTVIREMNRLGMIVDLSHVSTGTMRDALATSEAPVIFSHSSAYELCNSSRNVQDDILQSVAKNGGIVMVNFYSKFLSCSENSTVQNAVDHINHIKRIAGIDHVGLGAGFDGINFTPKGLEDVSTYPTLFAELLGEGWSVEDLSKLAGQNFLRVMMEVEKTRDVKQLAGIRPYEDHPNFRTEDPYNCTSS